MKHTILLTGCFLSTSVFSASNDVFLSAQELKPKPQTLTLALELDAVNETIDLFDLRESEGPVADGAGDYIGGKISAQYRLHPQFEIEGAWWQRSIDYTKDTNDLSSWLVGLNFFPNLPLDKNDTVKIRTSLWGNFADELAKTTPTQVNNHQFTQVKVFDPFDIQAQVDAIFSRRLDNMNQLNGFIQLGYSKVSVDSLNLHLKRGGCLFNLDIEKNNQFYAQNVAPCKLNPTDNGTIEHISMIGNANEYNIDVDKDMNYDAFYAGLGASWNWRYQDFESQIAYQYQRLWRSEIDDRVANFGHNAVTSNHTFGVKLSYDLRPELTVYADGQLFQKNFIGTIPFIYNGVTASRLDRRYGLASLGVKWRHF